MYNLRPVTHFLAPLAPYPALPLLPRSTGISITWALCIVPRDGWGAPWLVPLQIAIAFMAFIISGAFCLCKDLLFFSAAECWQAHSCRGR